jgi:hypothetical protein
MQPDPAGDYQGDSRYFGNRIELTREQVKGRDAKICVTVFAVSANKGCKFSGSYDKIRTEESDYEQSGISEKGSFGNVRAD